MYNRIHTIKCNNQKKGGLKYMSKKTDVKTQFEKCFGNHEKLLEKITQHNTYDYYYNDKYNINRVMRNHGLNCKDQSIEEHDKSLRETYSKIEKQLRIFFTELGYDLIDKECLELIKSNWVLVWDSINRVYYLVYAPEGLEIGMNIKELEK